jgi:hypothetical protein
MCSTRMYRFEEVFRFKRSYLCGAHFYLMLGTGTSRRLRFPPLMWRPPEHRPRFEQTIVDTESDMPGSEQFLVTRADRWSSWESVCLSLRNVGVGVIETLIIFLKSCTVTAGCWQSLFLRRTDGAAGWLCLATRCDCHKSPTEHRWQVPVDTVRSENVSI